MTVFFGKAINSTICICLFFIISLLPLAYNDYLPHPTQSGKFFVFCYSILIVLVFYLLKLSFRKSVFVITHSDFFILTLFAYITLNRYYFHSDYNLSTRYFEFMALMIAYVILRGLNLTSYWYLLIAVVGGGIIQAIYGNLQLYGYFQSNNSRFNITGSFFNPGPYAGYLASTFPVALGIRVFNEKIHSFRTIGTQSPFKVEMKYVSKIISLLGIFTVLLVVVATQSRAAWISIIISSIYVLLHYYDFSGFVNDKLRGAFKRWLVFSIVLSVALSAVFGLYLLKKNSADGRILIWKVTAKMIRNHPFIGHGYDHFKSAYMYYQGDHFKSNLNEMAVTFADNVVYTFNEPLQALAEIGIFGTLLYVIIIVLLFKTISKKRNPIIIIAKAGLVAILTFSFFSYPSEILPIKLNAIVFVVILISFHKRVITAKEKWEYTSIYSLKIGILSVLLSAIFFINIQLHQLYNAFEWWDTANLNYQMNNVAESIEYFDRAYPMLNREGEFLINYGKALAVHSKARKAILILNSAKAYQNNTILQITLGDSYKMIKRYDLAEMSYKSAWYMSPGKFYPLYLLVKLYSHTNQMKKANETVVYMKNKKVKIESIAIDQMLSEVKSIVKDTGKSISNTNIKSMQSW